MSIKVGHTSVTAVPGVDAKQHTSPGHQKMSTAQQPTQTQESPAYTVDLSVRERLENMDPADRIRWILSNFKRFDGTVTTGMDKEFEEKYRARQKEVTEKAQKDFNDMFEQIDPADLEADLKGDFLLGLNLYDEHDTQKHLDFFTPLHAESNERFEKYRNLANKIRTGGAEEFRRYNRLFAAMGAIANIEAADKEAGKRIARGQYTSEEYARAKSYASELQSRAGVFVAPDFDSPGTKYAASMRYAYNGSLANIGVKQLDFMARHREAEDIWVKVAQGAYNSHGEILSALKDAGLNDTANAYRESLSRLTRGKFFTIDDALKSGVYHETGDLWRAALNEKGQENTYAQLQRSIRGNDTSTIRYTASEIDEALSEGADEVKFLRNMIADRDPAFQYQLPDGRWTRARTKQELAGKNVQGDEETESRKKNNPLDAELRKLRNQLETVKKSYMPPDQKEELITSIKKRINTILIQMVAAQKGTNKKNSYEQI